MTRRFITDYAATEPWLHAARNEAGNETMIRRKRFERILHKALESAGPDGQIERISQFVGKLRLTLRSCGKKAAGCLSGKLPIVMHGGSQRLSLADAGIAVIELKIVEVDPQGEDAQALLREAAVEARALYPELFDSNARWPTNGPTPAGGFYLVAYRESKPVASGAVRPLQGNVAEVRRIFVTRFARKHGRC